MIIKKIMVMNRIEIVIVLVLSLLVLNIHSYYNYHGNICNKYKYTLLFASRDKIGTVFSS